MQLLCTHAQLEGGWMSALVPLAAEASVLQPCSVQLVLTAQQSEEQDSATDAFVQLKV